METLNNTLSAGGPDGFYTLEKTAEGALGFASLVQFGSPKDVDYIGQVFHETSGKHYIDTVNFNIKHLKLLENVPLTKVRAFSTSQIGGALGDNGQNYKNIIMAMKGAGFKLGLAHADDSCLPPEAPPMHIAV